MTQPNPAFPASFFDLDALRAEIARRERNRIDTYFPDEGEYRRELYPKHMQFFAAGGHHQPMPSCPKDCDGLPHRERCFMAANRVGKTDAGVYETSLHLTGLYPAWWTGKRFKRHIRAWAASDTNKQVRGVLQQKFYGPLSAPGTGMLPGSRITYRTTKQGVAEAIDTIYVKHTGGGISSLVLKSYQEGRESFQADAIDWILLDEEPPLAIYTESLIRTMTTDGMVALTMTPLQGLSEVVLSFLSDGLSEGR